MLREDSNEQADIKKADRRAGFERLYELLDWSALEFFDDDRLLFLGADKERGRPEAVSVLFNRDNFATTQPPVFDLITNELVRDEWEYFPKVDVTVTAGDGASRGKVATLQALSALTQANVTADNWRLYAAQLDILDIPNKTEIIEGWRQKFEPQAQPAPDMTGGAMPGMMPGAAPVTAPAAIEPSAPMTAVPPELQGVAL